MKYEFSSLKQILDLFENNDFLWASEISNLLWKSRTIVHKYLKELVIQKKLKKVWKWPLVKYKLVNSKSLKIEWHSCLIWDDYVPNFNDQKILENMFYKFSADWEIFSWFQGIKKWCKIRWLNLEEKIDNYISINKHIESLQNECWLLDAKNSFWKHFQNIYLDWVYYADQYKRMEFWRWKLAEMTFYAKQSQNKALIKDSIKEIYLKLECIIRKEWFDAIAITPWSIDRRNQLLGLLNNELKNMWLPFVNIIKYYKNGIPIPQKSLKTREQRIKNARNTIFIDDINCKKYKKVFLIDDFVWSWSTLNETASKLKDEWVDEVIWFAFVWNMNLDYEVINEV